MDELIKCEFCGKECKKSGIKVHIWKKHGEGVNHDPNIGYKNGNRVAWNKGLTKDTNESIRKFSESRKEKYKTGELTNNWLNRKHTDESKRKISEKRIIYLNENPDLHPWKNNNKFKSKPCELVKNFLKEKNISFIDEYNPIIDKNYSIDIAFPDIKLGIEINGNQHYDNDGNLKDYYKNRHELIENEGWKLLEIHYMFVYTRLDELLHIIDIKEQPDYSQYFNDIKNKKILKEEKNIENEKNRIINRENVLKKRIEKIEERKTLIRNSTDIDYSKSGWGIKLSKILGISSQKTVKFVKEHMLDELNPFFNKL